MSVGNHVTVKPLTWCSTWICDGRQMHYHFDANGDLVEKYSVRTNHDGGDEDPGRDVFVFELGPDGKVLR